MRTNTELVKYFGAVIKDDSAKVDFGKVNYYAAKYGYIVKEDACNESTMDFLDSLHINFNSTFYKTFEDVTSKDRWELFLDQIAHYASTYGTGHTQEGNGYVPNDGDIVLREQDFKEYRVIDAITADEMFTKVVDVLKCGIALSSKTVDAMTSFINDYIGDDERRYQDFMCGVFDNITNKEAVTQLCDKLGCTPTKKFDLFRYIIYKTTGQSMIVQNDETINLITHSLTPFDFSRLSESQMRSLASIYYRFKNLFCAFKHNGRVKNSPYINKLNRLAPKYHTPMEKGFWESLFEKKPELAEIESRLSEVTTYKLLQLYNGLQMRCGNDVYQTHPSYLVRNGKVFLRKDSKPMEQSLKNIIYIMNLSTLLINEIVRRVASNVESKGYEYVRYNNNIDYTCPTSEKNFIGDLPFGTSVPMDEHNFMGIYWRGEWGTQDFDLHMYDEYNRHIGWNARYHNDDNSVVFSGDMTSANPEATEVLYCRKNCPNGTLMVSNFSKVNGSKFKIFMGSEEIKRLHRNYMVNPDSIKCESEVMSTSFTQTIGMVSENTYYAMVMGSGNTIVPRNPELIKELFNSTITKARTMLRLNAVLGAVKTLKDIDNLTDDERKDIDGTKVLDLNSMTKDTLIGLFS